MVSVIIPAYNREKTVLRAVESVLNQTYKDIEVIVIDDGSTDNTKKVLENISDDRFRYVYQKNAGACVARNNGIKYCKGEYIAFHDSDDVWHLDKLEKQMKIFTQKNADLVFCKLLQYGADNNIVATEPRWGKEGFVEPITNLFGIGTQTIIAKRNVFETFKFDEKMPRFQEFELLLRISEKFSIYCLDEGLVDYYIGADSISSNPEKLFKSCCLIVEKHKDFRKKYPKMIDIMAYRLLKEANILYKDKNKDYKRYLAKANEFAISKKIKVYYLADKLGLYKFFC